MHRCKVLVPGGDDGLMPMTAPVGFQHQDVDGSKRLWVSVNGDWLETLQLLVKSGGATYKCVYEVRSAAEDGSDVVVESGDVSLDKVSSLCEEFADYLEIDPRHNFAIKNSETRDVALLDEHNFIFCTGDLDRFEALLLSIGLEQTEISLPTPHVHQLHDLFDDVEPKFVEALKSLR